MKTNFPWEYLISYYQRQEPQFVYAYTRKFPNLDANNTQRVEGKYPMVKKVTNKHTPIRVLVKLICAEIKNEQIEQNVAINNQHISNARLMDRNMFQNLIGLITIKLLTLFPGSWMQLKNL